MNKSEIAEKAAREIRDTCIWYDTRDFEEDNARAIVERAIAESQAPNNELDSLKGLIRELLDCSSINFVGPKALPIIEQLKAATREKLGDGEPSAPPELAREIAEWLYGKDYAYLDHVISQIAAIIWRSGAAQEVSPPSPEDKRDDQDGGTAEAASVLPSPSSGVGLPSANHPGSGSHPISKNYISAALEFWHQKYKPRLKGLADFEDKVRFAARFAEHRDELRGDTRELKAALKRYGDHDPSCAEFKQKPNRFNKGLVEDSAWPCNCGFSEARLLGEPTK